MRPAIRILIFRAILWVSMGTWILGCIEPYSSPDIKGLVDLLVVDGFINVSSQSATIKLSKAVPLDTSSVTIPIGGATVWIESDNNSIYNLPEQGFGTYGISNTVFDMGVHYRLHVQTSGEEYTSDYVELKRTSAIDSVTYRQDDNTDGLRIAVNSHQPDNSGRYYKWDYTETWEYETSFVSNFKLVNGVPVHRNLDEYIHRCYNTAESKKILISNTTSLSNDVVRDFPVTVVPGGTFKLSRRYSILVKQRALSLSEYQYWLQLQKNTETIGSLFDPQPAQLTGNFHSENSSRIVIGYFGGGEVTEKRIFVSLSQLSERLKFLTLKASCNDFDKKLILNEDLATLMDRLLLDPYATSTGPVIGYDTAPPRCVDCQIFGGVTKIPDFW